MAVQTLKFQCASPTHQGEGDKAWCSHSARWTVELRSGEMDVCAIHRNAYIRRGMVLEYWEIEGEG